MTAPGKGELHEVFLHAEWDADTDEPTPGETEGRGEIQKDIEEAQEQEGFTSFAEKVFSLARKQKNLPPPAWQLESEDASIATQLQRGLLGGGAARAHALTRPAWWIEVSPNGGTLALVRDSGLTILSSADEFSSPRFEWDGPAEMSGPMGRWRRVAWSEDCAILAVSDAMGSALLLSGSNGRPVARIPSLLPTAAPAVDLCFLGRSTPNEPSSSHVLLALSYEGVLYRHPFTIPFRAGLAATAVPPLDLSAYHTQVSCMAIHHGSKLLAFGGWDTTAQASPSVSLWKATEEAPYYDLVHTMGSSGQKGAQAPGVLGRLVAALSQRGRQDLGNLVIKLIFSPAGTHLAILQVSGALTVLKCGANTVAATHSAESLRVGSDGGREGWEGCVSDVAFWNDEALILSRRNGRVTIMPISGAGGRGSAEVPEVGWFHFCPLVSSGVSAREGGSLVLECRRRPTDGARGEAAGEAFNAGRTVGQEDAVVAWWWKLLFGAGTVEVGAGPKFVRRYCLRSVCKTTVERLLQRKMEMGSFEAALQVAAEHGLDTDQVHKKEWEESTVSDASVNTVLPKITDLSWVLNECGSRWPYTKSAAKLLTEYGLQRCRAARVDASELDDPARAAELEQREKALAARLERIELMQLVDASDDVVPARLRWFCDSKVDEVARVLAAEEDCRGLQILHGKYHQELGPCWLRVLAAIPESCRASKYESVLPMDPRDDQTVEGVVVADGGVAEWYVGRATEIERRAGLVDNALELLMLADGRVRGLEGLKSGRRDNGVREGGVDSIWKLVSELRQASTLVYECGVDVTLADLQRMSNSERLRAMCLSSEQASLAHDLREVARPLLSSVSSAEAQQLVSELVLGIAGDNLDLCAQVFEASRHTEPLFVFTSSPLGGSWLQNLTASFVEWAAAPPDSVRGRVGEEVRVVVYDPTGPGSRAQAEAQIAQGGGTAEVVVVMVKGLEEQTHAQEGAKPGEGAASSAPLATSVCVVMCTPAQIEAHASNAVARISRQRILHDPVAMVDLALRCVYRCNSVDFLPAMTTIYQSLPQRSAKLGSVEDGERYEELHKRADDLDKHLTAVEILHRYGQAKALSFFLSAHEQPDAALAILRAMSRTKVRQQEQNQRAWHTLQDDIAWLSEAVFSFLAPSACTNVYLEALLHANMFPLARALIESEKEKESEGSEAFGEYIKTVLAVARENLDSASSCDDAAWRNAEAILAMIPSAREEEEEEEEEEEDTDQAAEEAKSASKKARAVWGAEADKERDLMAAVKMLTELKVELLPIQVRQVTMKMEIIKRLVEEQPAVLRSSDKVLLLGQLLGLATDAEQHTLREFLGRTMLEGKYSVGGDGMLLSEGEAEVRALMHVGRESIWDLAWKLAQTAAVSVEQRIRFAEYAMTHCPAGELEAVRRGWKELGRLQRQGAQVLAAAEDGRWGAFTTWTAECDGELVEEAGPWAGTRRGAVMLHPFYSRDVPGGKSPAGVLVDPYVRRSAAEDELDLEALKVEDTVAEGLEVMAHIVRKVAGGRGDGAATTAGKKEREVEREREVRLRRRLAASLGQADSQLQAMALLAGSPAELLGSVRALCRSCFVAAPEGAPAKGADERLRAGLEGAVELGSAVCGVMAHASGGGELPLVLDSAWWGQRLQQARGEACAGSGRPLRQLLAEAEAGGTDAAAWARVGAFLKELLRCMKEHCTPGMPWTYRAVCDASVDVSVLLRTAVADGKAAGKKGAMEEVAAGAQKLSGALPGEEGLSAGGVRACVLAGELQEAWKKGGGGVAGGVDRWLEGLRPEERVLVAQDLVRAAENAAALSVLSTVKTELCEGLELKAQTEDKVRSLRLQVDQESAKGLQADMDGVRRRLEAAGIKKVPSLSAGVGELARFVEAAAERAASQEELAALAMLACLWDAALGPWLYLLSGGAIGKASDGAEYAGDGSIHGVDLEDGNEVVGATARCWAAVMRHALRLQLWKLVIALRKGPARYSLSGAEEEEMVRAAEAGGEALVAHVCVLSARAEMRRRGLELAVAGKWAGEEGGEEVEDLLESCVRAGLADRLESAPLLWRRPPLKASCFPSSSAGRATGNLEEEEWQGALADGAAPRLERGPYLVVKEGGAVALAVTSRRAEVLPLLVASLCEAAHPLRAGAFLLAATDTHPLLRTRKSALVALQAYLLRRSGERDQREEGAKKKDCGGVREGVRERCRSTLRRLQQRLSGGA